MWTGSRGSRSRVDPESDSDSDSPPSSPSSVSPVEQHGVDGRRARRASSKSTFSDMSPITSHWIAKRHISCGNPSPPPPGTPSPTSWRNKYPVKSFHGSIVICLNTGIDPPDVIKTDPCAVMEGWIDPRQFPSRRAAEVIGGNLQKQFEGLNSRMKFKVYSDPSLDDIEKGCTTLRRLARGDRCLFYYNGHGVPKPTASGELWVFNRDYSQYIPVSMLQLQSWLSSPTVYVWDCSSAGNLLTNFISLAEKRDEEMIQRHGGFPTGVRPFMECIQMAACLADEQLPMCPELPADLFTACLTSPIDIALRYFIMTHQLPTSVTVDMITKIPGDLKDRRTPLGELNWILTSITDTIAWTTFPRAIFQRLYRSDLMVAALFRNFLLAERIMKTYRCTPHTYPPLPPTNTHPMWASWDMAADLCLKQIPAMVAAEEAALREGGEGAVAHYEFRSSDFFVSHLKAFSIWLGGHGSGHPERSGIPLSPVLSMQELSPASSMTNLYNPKVNLAPRQSPDELPIILQVLLSNTYRIQALFLICQFMDLGPWAVHLCLLIGVFPYVQRLLTAPNQDLRAPLIFMWARIIAVDETCRNELISCGGWGYFASILAMDYEQQGHHPAIILPNPTEHRAMCLFILSEVCRNNPAAQSALAFAKPPPVTVTAFSSTCNALEDNDYLLKQWAALCLAQMWCDNDEIKSLALELGLQNTLVDMLGSDKSPEVRAACLYAAGTLLGAPGSPEQRGGGGLGSMVKYDEFSLLRLEITLFTGCTLTAKYDMSPMVRKELVTVLSCAVSEYRGWFIVAAWVYWEDEDDPDGLHDKGEDSTKAALYDWLDRMGEDEELLEMNRLLFSSIFSNFCVLLELTVDPYPEVAAAATTILDWIMACLIDSPFARLPNSELRPTQPPQTQPQAHSPPSRTIPPRSRVPSLQSDRGSPHLSSTPSSPGFRRMPLRSDTVMSTASRVSSTFKRTSSLANTLVNYAFPSVEDLRPRSSSPSKSGQSPTNPNTTDSFELRPPSPNLNLFRYQPPYASSSSQVPPSPANSIDGGDGNLDFSASDCIEALVEEDWERLRARRTRGRPDPGNGGNSNGHPSHPYSEYDAYKSGLGTGSSIKDVLPFRSKLYEWAREYFIEPQMRQAESDEPGSIQYNRQMWRRQRNDRTLVETKTQATVAAQCQWDKRVCSFQAISGTAMNVAFHAFDNYIAVANETHMVSIWDWSRRQKVRSFTNDNPLGSSITSLRWINEDIGGLVMVGSSEGIIRLYRNLDPVYDEDPLQLVTAFRALPQLSEVSRGAGLVTGWSQNEGTLFAGGDWKKIRPWNAHHEISEREILTGSESTVTSIDILPGQNQMFLASFGDGGVRLYDRRMDKVSPVVLTYQSHKAWVQRVRWQVGGDNAIVSASVDGEVRLWDLRNVSVPKEKWRTHAGGLSAFDMHNQTGVFATSSAISVRDWRTQTTLVHTLSSPGVTLGRMSSATGLHHPPSHPISMWHASSSALVFHPNEMLFATGGADGNVKIVGCNLGEYHTANSERLDSSPSFTTYAERLSLD